MKRIGFVALYLFATFLCYMGFTAFATPEIAATSWGQPITFGVTLALADFSRWAWNGVWQ